MVVGKWLRCLLDALATHSCSDGISLWEYYTGKGRCASRKYLGRASETLRGLRRGIGNRRDKGGNEYICKSRLGSLISKTTAGKAAREH